jgi:transcriptional regulator with XRE-family HTH domain
LFGTSLIGTVPGMTRQDRDNSLNTVAGRLKRTREAFKMSQADWCRLVGIETQAWNNYESGRRRISIDQAIKVCQATGVTIDWIYRGLMNSSLPPQVQIELQKRRPSQTS